MHSARARVSRLAVPLLAAALVLTGPGLVTAQQRCMSRQELDALKAKADRAYELLDIVEELDRKIIAVVQGLKPAIDQMNAYFETELKRFEAEAKGLTSQVQSGQLSRDEGLRRLNLAEQQVKARTAPYQNLARRLHTGLVALQEGRNAVVGRVREARRVLGDVRYFHGSPVQARLLSAQVDQKLRVVENAARAALRSKLRDLERAATDLSMRLSGKAVHGDQRLRLVVQILTGATTGVLAHSAAEELAGWASARMAEARGAAVAYLTCVAVEPR